MIVPGPRWSANQVARAHEALIAFNRGIGPLPWIMKRIAEGECRCAGAVSPDRRICTPAHSVDVAAYLPPRPGFMKAITWRSPPRSVGTNFAERWASGAISAQRQRYGMA